MLSSLYKLWKEHNRYAIHPSGVARAFLGGRSAKMRKTMRKFRGKIRKTITI